MLEHPFPCSFRPPDNAEDAANESSCAAYACAGTSDRFRPRFSRPTAVWLPNALNAPFADNVPPHSIHGNTINVCRTLCGVHGTSTFPGDNCLVFFGQTCKLGVRLLRQNVPAFSKFPVCGDPRNYGMILFPAKCPLRGWMGLRTYAVQIHPRIGPPISFDAQRAALRVHAILE